MLTSKIEHLYHPDLPTPHRTILYEIRCCFVAPNRFQPHVLDLGRMSNPVTEFWVKINIEVDYSSNEIITTRCLGQKRAYGAEKTTAQAREWKRGRGRRCASRQDATAVMSRVTMHIYQITILVPARPNGLRALGGYGDLKS